MVREGPDLLGMQEASFFVLGGRNASMLPNLYIPIKGK